MVFLISFAFHILWSQFAIPERISISKKPFNFFSFINSSMYVSGESFGSRLKIRVHVVAETPGKLKFLLADVM